MKTYLLTYFFKISISINIVVSAYWNGIKISGLNLKNLSFMDATF